MACPGKFLNKHFKGKKVEIFIGEQSGWLSYNDGDTMAFLIVIGTVKHYDEDSNILILTSETGHDLFISDDKIEMFWGADNGFNIRETTAATIRTGKQIMKRDIM